MASVYDIKPRFQALLRPLTRSLARRGVKVAVAIDSETVALGVSVGVAVSVGVIVNVGLGV